MWWQVGAGKVEVIGTSLERIFMALVGWRESWRGTGIWVLPKNLREAGHPGLSNRGQSQHVFSQATRGFNPWVSPPNLS